MGYGIDLGFDGYIKDFESFIHKEINEEIYVLRSKKFFFGYGDRIYYPIIDYYTFEEAKFLSEAEFIPMETIDEKDIDSIDEASEFNYRLKWYKLIKTKLQIEKTSDVLKELQEIDMIDFPNYQDYEESTI